MPLRRALILTFVLAMLVPPAAQADYQQVVTGNRFTVLRLTNATSCETGVGYRWSNVPGERSASVRFTQNGAPASLSGSSPYNNADPNYPAPAGLNQLFSESYFASAGDPNACEPVRQQIEQSFSATAQVTLTIAGNPPAAGAPVKPGVSPACTAARKGLAKRKKTVRTLRASYRKARSKRSRKRVKAKLDTAKKKQKSAQKVVGRRC